MQISKLAVAVAIALTTTGAFATNAMAAEEKGSTYFSDRTQYQGGEREQFQEQEKARLERQGFPQYNY